MKTILRIGANASLHIFDDDEVLLVNEAQTLVGDPVTLIIADCNTANCVVVENITPPNDWAVWKYFYVGGQWIPNLDWVDSQTPG